MYLSPKNFFLTTAPPNIKTRRPEYISKMNLKISRRKLKFTKNIFNRKSGKKDKLFNTIIKMMNSEK